MFIHLYPSKTHFSLLPSALLSSASKNTLLPLNSSLPESSPDAENLPQRLHMTVQVT